MNGWMAAELASTAVNAVVQGVALAAVVWLALRYAPRTAAATRHAVWMAALAAILMLPAFQAAPRRTAAPAEAGVSRPAIAIPEGSGWPGWALGAWGLVSGLLLARIGLSFCKLRRVKQRAVPVPEEIEARFEQLARTMPGRRGAAALASDEVQIPVAAGLWNPAILLPAGLVGELNEEETAQVLAHELAHIRRWDDWTNLAERVAEAVLFFHPAVRWITRRLSLEREIACDDRVVALTGTPRPYALCLTKLAAMHAGAAPQLAPGAVSKPQISVRVESLLAATTLRAARVSRAAVASACVALAGVAVLTAPVAPAGVVAPALPAPAVARPTAPAPEVARALLPVVQGKSPAAAGKPVQARRTVRMRIAQTRRQAPERPQTNTAAEQARVAATAVVAADRPPEKINPSPAAPPLANVISIQTPVSYGVFYLGDGQGGWIRVLWMRTISGRVLLSRI